MITHLESAVGEGAASSAATGSGVTQISGVAKRNQSHQSMARGNFLVQRTIEFPN